MTGPSLFADRRFLPLFITQFLGAFNDNFFKNAMVILITYKIVTDTQHAGMLVQVAAGAFILPFFLFSATAGQLADKYDRGAITRILKIIEIALMLFSGAALFSGSPVLLIILLFLAGTHSAFFGPIKYALLPQHLQDHELIAGNAYIEAGTYLAILGGTILGGILIMRQFGELMVSAGLTVAACAGYMSSRWIPPASPPEPQLKVNYNFFKETLIIVGIIKRQPAVFKCVLGISWFWAVGALLLSQLPAFCKNELGADETVVTFFLTTFTLGIGTGSVLCNRLLKGEVKTTFAAPGAIAMSVFIADLWLTSRNMTADTVAPLITFLSQFSFWRLTFDMFMLAACGGIFIVPLYAMMQARADKDAMARVIAGNNIINALFMVAAALAVVGGLSAGLNNPQIFLISAVINFMVGVYIHQLTHH
jgi:acyl-[acyl-carrier-protein]-phospholipid O-acyltransferase/long-chain-fatty-acid--[acyl-carrier-protein] ligase